MTSMPFRCRTCAEESLFRSISADVTSTIAQSRKTDHEAEKRTVLRESVFVAFVALSFVFLEVRVASSSPRVLNHSPEITRSPVSDVFLPWGKEETCGALVFLLS